MDKKIRIGVVGTGRGKTFMKPAECTGLKLAAVCDRRPEKLAVIKEQYDPDGDLMTFTDYDEMLKSDIDAVVLANYFNEHAPFAIKALRAGKHVLSECTAISTLAEGVALCRAVEETGKIYMIAENYPYTKQRLELKRVYDTGELGEMLYGEAEYCHPMSNSKTYKYAPGEFHWRNQIPSTYYCTHAIAQIMHITDTMPVRVNGFVPQIKDQSYRKYEYRQQDSGGIIVCQMNNGAVVRTLQGAFRTQSGIARLYGTKGSAEVERQTGNIVYITTTSTVPILSPTAPTRQSGPSTAISRPRQDTAAVTSGYSITSARLSARTSSPISTSTARARCPRSVFSRGSRCFRAVSPSTFPTGRTRKRASSMRTITGLPSSRKATIPQTTRPAQ